MGIVISGDNFRELTRKSTRGILVLRLVALLILGDERLTWCVRGSVRRLGDSDARSSGSLLILDRGLKKGEE